MGILVDTYLGSGIKCWRNKTNKVPTQGSGVIQKEEKDGVLEFGIAARRRLIPVSLLWKAAMAVQIITELSYIHDSYQNRTFENTEGYYRLLVK